LTIVTTEPNRYVVRYGAMRMLGVFSARLADSYTRSTSVIVRAGRGLEVGQVLCAATGDALVHLDSAPVGQILRAMTREDINELAHLNAARPKIIEKCQQHFRQSGLEIKLVDVEQTFGGERLVVYYLSEDRIDFRQLVKALSAEFQTRIEMRQIGVRDQAKLLADYGDCGKPVCCNTHLTSMPPVSMKMAKIQKTTLDPTKISGRCGRLKCCLRYEYDTYVELDRQLPAIGSHVVTRIGRGRVVGHEVLVQQVLLETEDHRRVLVDAQEILSVIRRDSVTSVDNDSPA